MTTRDNISKHDLERAKRLRRFRLSLASTAYPNRGMTMKEMASYITKKGYNCTQERYRNWELGYNIPGEVLAYLYDLGCDLNWLYTGRHYKSINKRKLNTLGQ